LCRWRIYQDFRTDRSAPVRQPALAQLETQVSPDGRDLVAALHTLYSTQRRFEEDVDQGMSAAFGEDYDRLVFPPSADGRVQLRLRWKSLQRESTTAELSDGTLRFLYLLTILSNPNPPPLIAIDEPETGLHPSMLDIVAEYAANAALQAQVVLTTHSAEFLDAITRFRPTVTVATWEIGETKLRVMDSEKLEYWLQEYALGRLFRTGELEFIGTTS
jgi:predicted ATPase